MGMLMLGNFMKESGVVGRLVDVSQNAIANITTLFLGLCIGSSMLGGNFLQPRTLLIFGLGLLAISLDTVAGVMLGKLMRVISRGKINPLIGAAGTSAFPMSSRVVQREGQKANPRSFLLFHAVGANTGGQIGSVMAAAVMLAILAGMGIGPLACQGLGQGGLAIVHMTQHPHIYLWNRLLLPLGGFLLNHLFPFIHRQDMRRFGSNNPNLISFLPPYHNFLSEKNLIPPTSKLIECKIPIISDRRDNETHLICMTSQEHLWAISLQSECHCSQFI